MKIFSFLSVLARVCTWATVCKMADGSMSPVAMVSGRMRDKSLTAQNVVAGSTAFIDIPRYERTLQRVILKQGGTTFTKAHMTSIKLKLGSKTISQITGSDLAKLNQYDRRLPIHGNYSVLDFTNPESKDIGQELVGGIDLTMFPPGRLYIEIAISSSASAPTLEAEAVWAPPQGNNIIKRLMQFTVPLSVAGKNTPVLNLEGANVLRMFMIYTGTDWYGTAAATAWTGNTGDGAMGAITVSSGAKMGTYKLTIVEPAANAGTFIIQDPDGIILSKKGQVASAYSFGGLAFTLADGATDFTAGDGFDIAVGTASASVDGNLNRVVVKKNGVEVFDRTCNEARQEQRDYGLSPQALMYAADFVCERNAQGMLRTDDATSLEWNLYATATDTVTMYAEVLQSANTL